MVLYIDSNERDGEPGPKGKSGKASNRADGEDMSVRLGHIHGGLKHHDTEWNAGYPTDETDDAENGKESEDDACGVVLLIEIIHCSCNSKDNMEDSSNPNELLGEQARKCEVQP